MSDFGNIQHSAIPAGQIHTIANWLFASEAARAASSGYTVNDLHKVAYVTETSQYWALASVSPLTWVSFGGGTGGATNLSFTRNSISVTVLSSSGTGTTIPAVDSLSAGVMTAAQKAKLDGIEAGAQVNVIPTWASVTGKPVVFPPSSHTHSYSEITGLPAGLTLRSGTTTVNFGTTPSSDTFTVVTGQTGLAANARVFAWISPLATASHSADEHIVEEIRIFTSTIVANDRFTIHAVAGNFPLKGSFTVSYLWINP